LIVAETVHDNLCRRLQRLEDIEAIRRLKATYLNACDTQDSKRAKECFAEGEILIDFAHVGIFRSRDEWETLYRAAGCHPFVLDQHHGANAEIDFVDDSRARALWALGYRNINTQEHTVTFLSVLYHDEFTKFGTQWKITRCRAEFKTALHCSYATGVLETLTAARSLAPASPAT
jgi:hypothetical protein